MRYQSQKEVMWTKMVAERLIHHDSRNRTTFNDMYTRFVQSAFLEYPNKGHEGQIYAAESNLWAFLFDTPVDFPGINPIMSRDDVGNESMDLGELPDTGISMEVEGSDLDMVRDNITSSYALFSVPIPTTQAPKQFSSFISAIRPATVGSSSMQFTSSHMPIHSATTIQAVAQPSHTEAGRDFFGRRNAGFESTNSREATKRTRESSLDSRLYREDQRIPKFPAPWVYDPENDEDLYDE